jgi:hypothetical protein
VNVTKLKKQYEKFLEVMRAKARSIMFTTLVILGLLQVIAGAIMDIILYGLAVGVVLFFTKITRK